MTAQLALQLYDYPRYYPIIYQKCPIILTSVHCFYFLFYHYFLSLWWLMTFLIWYKSLNFFRFFSNNWISLILIKFRRHNNVTRPRPFTTFKNLKFLIRSEISRSDPTTFFYIRNLASLRLNRKLICCELMVRFLGWNSDS